MTGPFWTFGRPQRLQELVDRQRKQERFLTRERCDVRDIITRAAIDARLAVVQGRLRRLQAAARCARREARIMTATV